MIASNALLAELLKMKLAAIPIEYTLVSELPTWTPNTLKLMKNKITIAKANKMRSRVRRASPASLNARDRNLLSR